MSESLTYRILTLATAQRFWTDRFWRANQTLVQIC